MITSEGVNVPENNVSELVNSSKNLEIPQANGNREEAARKSG